MECVGDKLLNGSLRHSSWMVGSWGSTILQWIFRRLNSGQASRAKTKGGSGYDGYDLMHLYSMHMLWHMIRWFSILSQTTYLFWYMVSSPHLGTSNAQFVDLPLKALPLEVQKSLKQTSLGCPNWIQELEETGIRWSRCVVLVSSSWYHERAPWFLGPNWTAWLLLLD